jgi:CHASE2 domain-containing sensor protein
MGRAEMHPGWISAIVGVAGGLFGTYCGIKNTNGPRERAFMIKASVVCWVYVFGYLLLLVMLPRPYGWFAAIPYALFLCLGIVYANRTQQRIRQEESEMRATRG